MALHFFKTVFTFLGIAIGSIAFAADPLLPFEAKLKATRFGAVDVHLTGTMYLRTKDNQWEFALNAKKGGISTQEVSKGTLLQDNRFLPTSYNKKARVFLIKEDIEWRFDWPKNKVTGQVKKDKLSHTIKANTFDPLSYQLELRQQLKTGATELNVINLRYKNPEPHRFEVIGEELLDVDGDLIYTKIVKQVQPQKKDTKYLIWVAPELDYITLKFASYRKGKLKDLVEVESLTINGQPINL